MYARSFEKDRRPFQIPEHYSGSLFADQAREQSGSDLQTRPNPEHGSTVHAEKTVFHGSKVEHKNERSEQAPLSVEIQESMQKMVGKICAGLGFDRLLILGLMLLLAGADGGSELILWLALLLFV